MKFVDRFLSCRWSLMCFQCSDALNFVDNQHTHTHFFFISFIKVKFLLRNLKVSHTGTLMDLHLGVSSSWLM